MFTKSTYLVRERVGILKLADTYDILEADTAKQVAVAIEKPGWFIHILRFLIDKQMLPTKVYISPAPEAQPILSIHRGFSFLRPKIMVFGADGGPLGYFKRKLFSLGGAFYVFNNQDVQIAEVKGDWKGWNFKFMAEGAELGTVSRQWGGIAKELFTTADNYVINLAQGQPQNVMLLLVAAGISIDIVFKERA